MENNKYDINPNASAEALLRRVELFLEDGEWEKANAYCESVLDMEPENATAYVYKLMAELNISRRECLSDASASFKDNKCFEKALRFGSEELCTELNGYLEAVEARVVNDAPSQEESCENDAVTVENEEISAEASCEQAESTDSEEADEASDEATETQDESAEEYYDDDYEEDIREKGVVIKIIVGVIAGLALICGAVAACIFATPYLKTLTEYNNALAILDAKDYDKAYSAFEALGDFKDAEERFAKFVCLPSYTEELFTSYTVDDGYAKVEYEYSPDGRVLKSISTATAKDAEDEDEGETTVTVVENTYDKNGRLITSETTINDEFDSSISYEYDKSGGIVKTVSRNSKGEETVTNIENGKDGAVIKETVDYADGGKRVIEYTYDGNRSMEKKSTYTSADGEKGTVAVETYEYNANGLVIKHTNSKNKITEYEYDSYGNCIKETRSDGIENTIVYRYDEDGNMLKKTEKYGKPDEDPISTVQRNYCDYHYYYND